MPQSPIRPRVLATAARLRPRRLAAALLVGAALCAAPPAAFAQPTEAPAAEEGVYFPETFTLSNGMQVVVVENPSVPVVTHMVWYKAGAADEPRGKSGIAHLLEHLMFKATDELAAGEFSQTVAKHGGKDNAFTSWDYTAYHQTIAADQLELVMEMEADRMADLRLTDEVVLPELEVVKEERRQRTENEPADRLGEQVRATLFVHHPYGTPIIGWMHEIEGLTRADAEEWYRTWYVPNNAVLVVSGDVTAEEVRELAEKHYGKVPARPVPERVRAKEPPLTAERRVILEDAEVRQPTFYRYYKAPSYTAGATEHAYPLQVLSEIMGGGATSRLYENLVVDRKIATAAGLGYSPDNRDLATAIVWGLPAPGVDMETLEAEIDAEIGRLLKEGVTDEEVERAKKRLRANAVYARDSLSGPAHALGSALAAGRTVEDVEAWPKRIGEVTAEQVEAAAAAVFGQPDHVSALLLPTPATEVSQ